jgi:phosphatidylcholine synthase
MTVRQRVLAWSVHLFTGLGLVAAAGIAVLIVHGGDDSFRAAFALMWLATGIDAVDGTFAKMARVGEVLPWFDGRRLDDIIDFHTYTSLPLLLIWRSGILPGEWSAVLLFPLLASAYGFSRSDAKTDDGYFLGFPSYWNIVAFYVYFLGPPAWLGVAAIVILALLTFVPSRYLYSTQPGRLSRIANLLAAPWAVLLIAVLLAGPEQRRILALVSLYFPVFYMGASWWVTIRRSVRN